MDDIIGLIPAAGKGLRLGLPYPKELYPVIRDNCYKPIAQFVLTSLILAGVRHVVFVVNETKHQLMGYFGSGRQYGCDLSYVFQDHSANAGPSTSPGLAHALCSAYHLVRGKTVFFGMADTIMKPADVFRRAYQAASPDDDAVLVLFPTCHPEKFGMVELGANGRVLKVVDKPRTTLLTAMWGCIIWRPSFTEYLHQCVDQQGISDFAHILNGAIASGMRFHGYAARAGSYLDLGTYDEISEMDRSLVEA
jgi:glucose-1-phosphate thymidylyltransferase